MKKPVLVIMAAGMGSRYGGLKQIDPIGKNDEIIMDYSIYDAKKAGFEKAVIIIKKENEQLFKEAVGDRLSRVMQIEYAYQELNNIPSGFTVPEGRTKPWGTGHAVLCAADKIDGPFAVINADDFYGSKSFKLLYDFLIQGNKTDKQSYCMAGFNIKNTLTENGHVARGVCVADENGILTDITERVKIQRNNGIIQYTEDDGSTWTDLDEDTIVSMNCWGFEKEFLSELKTRFSAFLQKNIVNIKSEYFLPFVVDELISEDKATVTVLRTDDKWYGVTYKEDKEQVVKAIREMTEKGLY